MNVIVIVSDTFRKDHLGCYGNSEVQTPNLDRFAEEATFFTNCYAGSFPTMPMRADFFTGKFTFNHLKWGPLPREEKPLSELLGETGYKTLAAVDTPFFTRNGYGYDRGFDDYTQVLGQYIFTSPDTHEAERPRLNDERQYEEDYYAPKTIKTAKHLLEYYYGNDFFLHVDMWDPHEPWDPPDWYVEKYITDYDGEVVGPCYGDWEESGYSKNEVEKAHSLYKGEIAMVDHWVGQLIDKVKAMDLWEDTAIVFTSDHGFYFGEHGYFGKVRQREGESLQSPLYKEVTEIPLIMHIPGNNHKEITQLVSVVDLMPTILDLAGVETPEKVQGKSLLPLGKLKEGGFRDFVVTSPPLYNPGEESRIVDDWLRTVEKPHFSTLTTTDWSFLYSTKETPAQLYDLNEDPQEKNNVIKEHPQVAQELHKKFVHFLEEIDTEDRYLKTRKELTL